MNDKGIFKSSKIVHSSSLNNQLSSHTTANSKINAHNSGNKKSPDHDFSNMHLLKKLIKTQQIVNYTKKFEDTSNRIRFFLRNSIPMTKYTLKLNWLVIPFRRI